MEKGSDRIMATVNQMYGLVNKAQQYAYGELDVNVIDTSSFVSLGNKVLSSEENKDLFVNTLFDRIWLGVSDTRLYNAANDNIIRRDFEYGIAMQKIHVEPVEAQSNPEWLIGSDDFTPEYAPVLKPVVKQKIFSDMVTWENGVTIPDNMLKTAFVNEVQFGAFLVAVMNALENGMELCKERAIDLTRSTMIAYIIKNGNNAINLVDEYNKTLPTGATPLTTSEFLTNEKALSFGAMLMSMTVDRMERFNKLFNSDGYSRFTPKDLLRVDVLNVLDYAVKYSLRPVVYNERFIQLPNYNVVPYWMGAGTDYSFDNISTVNVSETHTDTETGDDVTTTVANQSGVLAVMYDTETCGVNIFGEESAFERNNRAHYTTHYRQMTAQYYYDSSEQGVVFYIADTNGNKGTKSAKAK